MAKATARYEDFLRTQEEALFPEEIIEEWFTTYDTEEHATVRADIAYLCQNREDVSYEVLETSCQLGAEIEDDYARLTARFGDHIKEWVHERAKAFRMRMQSLLDIRPLYAESAELFEDMLQCVIRIFGYPSKGITRSDVEMIESLDEYLVVYEKDEECYAAVDSATAAEYYCPDEDVEEKLERLYLAEQKKVTENRKIVAQAAQAAQTLLLIAADAEMGEMLDKAEEIRRIHNGE
jgi:hypothetical protein